MGVCAHFLGLIAYIVKFLESSIPNQEGNNYGKEGADAGEGFLCVAVRKRGKIPVENYRDESNGFKTLMYVLPFKSDFYVIYG